MISLRPGPCKDLHGPGTAENNLPEVLISPDKELTLGRNCSKVSRACTCCPLVDRVKSSRKPWKASRLSFPPAIGKIYIYIYFQPAIRKIYIYIHGVLVYKVRSYSVSYVGLQTTLGGRDCPHFTEETEV